MIGVPLNVSAEEMDAFNALLVEFQGNVAEACPKIRILGMFVGAPAKDGPYGVLVCLGPKMTYEKFAEITTEMGQWMKKFETQ